MLHTRVAVAAVFTLLISACAQAPDNAFTTSAGRPVQPGPVSAQAGDGYIAEGQSISPFDDTDPAVANLDPALRTAMQRAAKAAQSAGVTFRLNSGWRSARYQQLLLDRAVSTYGSEKAARRFVSSPERSAHVKGKAVDIGPTDADSWLSQHGNDYGLCQTYSNEMWHYELSTTPGGTCPEMIADASAG